MIGLPRRGCVGRYIGAAVKLPQIAAPPFMIALGVPEYAAVIARGIGIEAIEHGIKRELIGNRYLSPVPCEHADRRCEPAARAFAADHYAGPIDAELIGVFIEPFERSIAILQRGGIRSRSRKAVFGRDYNRAVALRRIESAGKIDHFRHAFIIAAAVEPQKAGKRLPRILGL